MNNRILKGFVQNICFVGFNYRYLIWMKLTWMWYAKLKNQKLYCYLCFDWIQFCMLSCKGPARLTMILVSIVQIKTVDFCSNIKLFFHLPNSHDHGCISLEFGYSWSLDIIEAQRSSIIGLPNRDIVFAIFWLMATSFRRVMSICDFPTKDLSGVEHSLETVVMHATSNCQHHITLCIAFCMKNGASL